MRKRIIPILFIGPHAILFIVFFLIPTIFGLYIAFTEWDLYGIPQFIGLENFKTILLDANSLYHEQFFNGARNTILFVFLCVPFSILTSLILAVAISIKPRGYRFFQSILYLPTLFAISAVMIIWSFQLSLSYGPFSEWFGLKTNLVSTQPWAWIVLVVVTIWWSAGGNMIIYVAALNNIPTEQLEAASLDGANGFVTFFKVVLPNMKYQLVFTLIMTTVAQFNIYGQPLMLTGGGPNNSTRVLMMYIQSNVFGSGVSVAGMAAAMAVLLGLVIMIFLTFQFILLKKWNE